MVALVTIIAILLTIFKIAESLSILTVLVFLVLKLCKVITWSWVCVCIPLFVLVGLSILSIVCSVISAKLS